MQPTDTILFINPHIHNHPDILIILSVCLTNQIIKTSFTFLTTYTHVTNSLYFIILKLYKVILYL